MIDRIHVLPIARQAKALHISRTRPLPASTGLDPALTISDDSTNYTTATIQRTNSTRQLNHANVEINHHHITTLRNATDRDDLPTPKHHQTHAAKQDLPLSTTQAEDRTTPTTTARYTSHTSRSRAASSISRRSSTGTTPRVLSHRVSITMQAHNRINARFPRGDRPKLQRPKNIAF